MSKDNAVSLLREQGYKADSINGVVYVESDNPADFGKVYKLLQKAGYTNSYGWKKRGEEQ